jgi:hypothetical protein
LFFCTTEFGPIFIVLYGISIISTFIQDLDFINYPRSQVVDIIEVLLYVPTTVDSNSNIPTTLVQLTNTRSGQTVSMLLGISSFKAIFKTYLILVYVGVLQL